MPRKAKTANAQNVNTAVNNPSAIFNNITLPQPEDKGLFSWKSEAKRDWFILRWS